MLNRSGRAGRILIILAAVAVVLVGLAAGVYESLGLDGLTGLSVVVSGLLTAALVILYFQQTRILDAQRDLFAQDLNRDVRQKHTEILRHRIEEWLGHSPGTREEFGDVVARQPTLPVVTPVGVQSAAKTVRVVGDEEFLAAPSWLQDDQYFDDLLENHAPELDELKTEIEELEAEFSEQKERFIEQVGKLPQVETDEYVIEPAYNFEEWVFEQILLLERGYETHDELIDRASSVVSATAMRQDDVTVYPGEEGYGMPIGVIQARTKTGDYDAISENRDEIEDEIVSLLRSVIRDIDEINPYDSAREAGETLDEMSEAVEELRFKLEEYQGLPLYPEDCEYLESELID